MENIAAYLEACTALGVRQFDLFQTVELFEGKNLRAVVTNIHALGRVAQQLGFDGPTLGARMATAKPRTFSQEQMNQARAIPTFLNKGSSSGAKKSVGSDTNRGIVRCPSNASTRSDSAAGANVPDANASAAGAAGDEADGSLPELREEDDASEVSRRLSFEEDGMAPSAAAAAVDDDDGGGDGGGGGGGDGRRLRRRSGGSIDDARQY